VGFLAPAVVGVATVGLPWWGGLPALLAAGAVEGAVLGGAQATVLRRELPALRRDRWVALTAAAAVAAYVLGAGTTYAGTAAPWWLQGVLFPVLGVALLCTIGAAQWVELRHHVPRAGRWIGWTAVAWLCALGAFLAIASPLWHEGQGLAYGIAVGVVAGVVMAAVQAVVTGWGLVRLLRDADRSRPDGSLARSAA
uniref:hypothetical protein n=1 Tax=Nocardioides pelophilus TaxID=2172019 RepID=UPI0015FEE894